MLLLPAVVIAAALDPALRLGLRAWVFASATFAAVVAAFPVSILLGGGIGSTLAYLLYQLRRHDQSSPATYLDLIEPYFGWPMVAFAFLGLLVSLRLRGGRRTIAIWALVPGLILQAWGLRELQLPMVATLQIAVLAAIGIEAMAHRVSSLVVRWGSGAAQRDLITPVFGAGLLAAVVVTLAPLTATATSLPSGQPFQSGLREASRWLRDHSSRDDGVFVSTAYKSSVVAYYSHRPAYGFIPARRRDPLYRDAGDVEAFWRAGGIQWVVLDRDSRARADAAEDEGVPYDRLVGMLGIHANQLAHVVPGPTPDDWLAQVYRLTESAVGEPTVSRPAIVGSGDRRIVVLSYAGCISIAAAIVVIARRSARRSTRS